MIFTNKATQLLSLLICLNSEIIFTQNTQAHPFNSTFSQESVTTQQPSNYTGIVQKIDRIAGQITVKINDLSSQNYASGVIIAKQGDDYYVLTAKHLLCINRGETNCQVESQYQIVTPDGSRHDLEAQNITIPSPNIDIAIAKFTSEKTYSVATIADYQLKKQWIFLSGFTQEKDGDKERILTAGKVFPRDEAYFVVRDSYSLKNGNELVYTNDSYSGMAGGALLDSQGRLVGIHSGSENEVYFDEQGNYEQYKLGFSLGIPVKYLLSSLSKTHLQTAWLKIEKTPATPVNLPEALQSHFY